MRHETALGGCEASFAFCIFSNPHAWREVGVPVFYDKKVEDKRSDWSVFQEPGGLTLSAFHIQYITGHFPYFVTLNFSGLWWGRGSFFFLTLALMREKINCCWGQVAKPRIKAASPGASDAWFAPWLFYLSGSVWHKTDRWWSLRGCQTPQHPLSQNREEPA